MKNLTYTEHGDDDFLECCLPHDLSEALEAYMAISDKDPAGPDDVDYNIEWTDAYSELVARINSAEAGEEITTTQALYLRRKYVWGGDDD